MKILHLRTLSDRGGGPEKTIFNSCKKLYEYDIRADVAYIIDSSGVDGVMLREGAQASGINLFVIEESCPFSLQTFRNFKGILYEGGYDIVHSHDYKTHFLAAIYKKRFGYGFVATVHGYNATTFREKIYYRIDRFSLGRADIVIVPGQYLAEELKKKFNIRNVEVVYNGIDLNDWRFRRLGEKDKSDRFNLLYVGRLSREKNVELLLNACGMLLEEGAAVRLTIVGEGREEKRLKTIVRDKGIRDFVDFVGFVSHEKLYDLLVFADVLVLPSVTEVFPNVLLEAMSVGVPVIASNVGAVGELVRNGIEGLLFDSGNVCQLKEKIELVMSKPDLAQQFALSARTRVEREFSFDKHLRETIALYEKISSFEFSR